MSKERTSFKPRGQKNSQTLLSASTSSPECLYTTFIRLLSGMVVFVMLVLLWRKNTPWRGGWINVAVEWSSHSPSMK